MDRRVGLDEDVVQPTLRYRENRINVNSTNSPRQTQGQLQSHQPVDNVNYYPEMKHTITSMDSRNESYFAMMEDQSDYSSKCVCWCGHGKSDLEGREGEPYCSCAKPRCCNLFMCAVVFGIQIVLGVILIILVYFAWPRVPEYVYLHETPFNWDLNYYGELHNTSAKIELAVYNHFKVPVIIHDIQQRISVNDSNGILNRVGTSTGPFPAGQDQILQPEQKGNITTLLWIPFASNTTVAPVINESLLNFTITFGLDGYVTGSLWGITVTAYTDCMVQVYFKNNGEIPLGPPASWTQDVNWANCTYSLTFPHDAG